MQLPFLCVAHLSVSAPEYRPPIPSGQRPFLTPHASRFHWHSLFTLGSFFAALGLSRKAVHDSDPCLYLRRLFPSLVANKSSRIQEPCSFPSYALLTFRYQRPSIVLSSPLAQSRFSLPCLKVPLLRLPTLLQIILRLLFQLKIEYYFAQAHVFAYIAPLCVANLSVSTLRLCRVETRRIHG